MSTPKFFQPITVGKSNLQHRVVLAPLTRCRSSRKEHIPTLPLMETYYSQRSSRPGSLLITEATLIRPEAGGLDNVPGIWSQDQIEAWQKVRRIVALRRSPGSLSFHLGCTDYQQSSCQWLVHSPAIVGPWKSRDSENATRRWTRADCTFTHSHERKGRDTARADNPGDPPIHRVVRSGGKECYGSRI